jgi:pimeloyl-ACP methyl ester carboxylesterase
MISRLPATDPALRRGALFTTGGGPGGAGVPEPLNLAAVVDPPVLARYDIVGFDMRFVERSTPITCGQPEEEPGDYWVRSATYQSLKDTAAEGREYARACARHAGWALPFATTAKAARDMDALRARLGERKLSFLGGSYAALLGVAYGTLFPHRVGRFVLDSPVNYDFAWRPYELKRLPAFEENYTAFTRYLADSSAAFGLGTTPAEVAETLSQAFAEAAIEPIVAGDHAWTAGELGSLTVIATYFEHLWPVVATNLAAILSRTPPPIPLDPRPAPLPGTPGVPADNHTAVNMAFRCGDNAWPRDLATWRPIATTWLASAPAIPSSARRSPTSTPAPSGRSARTTPRRSPTTGRRRRSSSPRCAMPRCRWPARSRPPGPSPAHGWSPWTSGHTTC